MTRTHALAPLLAVTLVFRSKPEFSSLSHVVDAVSLFLDSSVDLPLDRACNFGSLTLLDRIWSSSEIFTSENKNIPENPPWTLRRYIRTDGFYRKAKLRLSLIEAIRLKNLEMVRWLLDKFEDVAGIDGKVVLETMGTISTEVLQLIYSYKNDQASGRHVDWDEDTLAEAISQGRHDIVWWLQQHFPSEDFDKSEALMRAVLKEDIVMAEWLYDHGAQWRRASPGDNIGHEMAARGRLDILKWLTEGGRLDDGAVVKAAANGHLHVVRWLMNPVLEGYETPDDLSGEAVFAIHAAAVNGHLEVAKYLHDRTKTTSSKEQRSAAVKAQLKRSRELGYRNDAAIVSAETVVGAARNGHLEVVRWLYEEFGRDPDINIFAVAKKKNRGYHGPADATAMDAAASNGHLEVLKYLHELQQSLELQAKKRKRGEEEPLSSPKCTKAAMDGAAAAGYLDVVRWLHQNRSEGCSARAMGRAAAGGHLHVLKWLAEHRLTKCTTAAMDGAAANGHLDVVQWLHDNTNGACTTEAMDEAATMGHLDIVKWLHKHRREGCTPAAMDRAARSGFLNVVKWLHDNRSEGCTEKAMELAAARGHLTVVKWLQAHRSNGYANSAVDSAAWGNQFDVFLFLHDHCGAKCTANTALMARDAGSVDVFNWIVANYPDIQVDTDSE